MQEYLNLLEKYECKLVDGKIINKHDRDTNIIWESIISVASLINAFSGDDDNKKYLFNVLEQQLKLTYNRR